MQQKPKKRGTPAKGKNLTTKDTKGIRRFWPLLVILPLVFIAFSPILKNELTNWDDPDLIIDNPLIRSLGFENMKTIFTTYYFGNYQPLHLLSYAVEYHFWQLNPAGYHAVSLALFLGIAALAFWFIYLIGKRNITLAAIATLLFSLNAMRVESVAWAAERKDMLYGLFYLSALIAYVYYLMQGAGQSQRAGVLKSAGLKSGALRSENTPDGMNPLRGIGLYLLVFLFFLLSVFSKVMAVSLVGALVMLDYLYARNITLRMVLEKIPFVAVSIAVGLAQVAATASADTFDQSGRFNTLDRILIVCRNFVFYLYKMLLPLKLSAFHPYPDLAPGAPWPAEFYISVVVVLLLIGLLIWSLKKTRIIFFTLGFIFSALALVLQYVAVGPAMFNERYSLIPAVAFSFALASGIGYLASRFSKQKFIVYGITGIYLVFMFYLTFARCAVWKTSLTLWDDVLAQYPKVATALNNRGKYYGRDLGDLDRAKHDLTLSILYQPDYPNAYSNRGIVYCMQGKFDSAIADFDACIKLPGPHYDAYLNRAIAYAQTNRAEQALADFNQCIQTEPNRPEGAMNRGILYLYTGKSDKALEDLNRAIELRPDIPEPYLHRARVWYNLGKYPEAARDLQTATNGGMKADPAFTELVKNALPK